MIKKKKKPEAEYNKLKLLYIKDQSLYFKDQKDKIKQENKTFKHYTGTKYVIRNKLFWSIIEWTFQLKFQSNYYYIRKIEFDIEMI